MTAICQRITAMPTAYKYHENTDSRPRRISRVSHASAKKLTRPEISSPAAIIGRVTPDFSGRVVLRTEIGTRTLLPEPSGELLPRIC